MWFLSSPSGDVLYELTPGKVHTVSRKVGDIILADDGSVSRKHACFEVKSFNADGVSLWDDNSKFGTYVNNGINSGEKIPLNVKVNLKEGSKVRFGLQNNIWTLKRKLLCVCAQMLKPADKSKVKAVVSQMGGKLVDKWSEDATHLTTNSLRLTFDVMCALASATPIVSPVFWQHYARMICDKGAVVDPSKFIPVVEDKRLIGKPDLCCANLARKALFKNKLFVFPSSQSYKVYSSVIEMAGGKAWKLSNCGMSLEDYCKPHVVVINCPENEQTSFYNKVLSTLIEKSLRVIPEEDIGLAIWKISTAMHCNPSFSHTGILLKLPESHTEQDTGATLVMNTEDIAAVASTGINFTDQVIPPSYSDIDNDRTDIKTEQTTGSETQAGSSHKRIKDSSVGIIDNDGPKLMGGTKTEPPLHEDEDMFADELSQPKISAKKASFSKAKIEKRPAQHSDFEDDFFLPSPPKKKKPKQSLEEDDDDLFALPKVPCLQRTVLKEEEDVFDFLDNRSNKSSKNNTHNETVDLFNTTKETNDGASTSEGRKRKEREGTESDSPAAKRHSTACANVTNVIKSKIINGSQLTFLHVEKEVKDEPDNNTEHELACGFQAKVVVRPLVKRSVNRTCDTTMDATESKHHNFKKFRKVWSGSETKLQMTTHRISPGYNKLQFGNVNHDDSKEEDEDDNFLSSVPARRNVTQSHESDDEFALPSFSQV